LYDFRIDDRGTTPERRVPMSCLQDRRHSHFEQDFLRRLRFDFRELDRECRELESLARSEWKRCGGKRLTAGRMGRHEERQMENADPRRRALIADCLGEFGLPHDGRSGGHWDAARVAKT